MTNCVKKIKAIVFDWGGVCCKEGEPFASKYLQRALKMTPEEIAEKAGKIYIGYYEGEFQRDTFWRAIIKHFNLKENKRINPAALSKAYLDSYAIYPKVMRKAMALKKKYQVSLLSNLTPEMRDLVLKKHQLKKYFQPMFFSCDPAVAKIKPDFKLYKILLKKINLKAEQCLFIDNSIKNIKAAKLLGFKTIFFKTVKQFLDEIKKYE